MQENFVFGKLDYRRIYFSLTVKAALSLLNSCCGTAKEWQEEGCVRRRTPPPAQRLLQLFGCHRQDQQGWVGAAAGESSRMSPGR